MSSTVESNPGTVVHLLGPVGASVDGVERVVRGAKPRALLAVLAFRHDQVVSVVELVDSLWDEPAPAGAEHTLQQHVSSLRKLLEPDRSALEAPSILLTRSPGYLLHVDSLDSDEFERSAAEGFAATQSGRWTDAVDAFDAALACWHGPALGDARSSQRLSAIATGLEQRRLAVVEARIEGRLASGGHVAVIPELEQLIGEHPYRERLRAQLMLALYRSDRQAEALGAYRAARELLVDELGIDPSSALADLEQAILDHDPALLVSAAAPLDVLEKTFGADAPRSMGWIELPDGQIIALTNRPSAIGRSPSADIRLVDSRVSREHARIDTETGTPTLVDLGSTNGTTVNGEVISTRALRDGDTIGLGGVELRFRRGAQ